MSVVVACHGDTASRLGRHVDNNPTVHLLIRHIYPFAIDADLRLLIGRAVETLRETRPDVHGSQRAVADMGRHCAVVPDLSQDLVQQLTAGCGNLHQRVADIVTGLADRDVLNAELSAALSYAVEDPRQDQAVDNVPADFDVLDELFGLDWWLVWSWLIVSAIKPS